MAAGLAHLGDDTADLHPAPRRRRFAGRTRWLARRCWDLFGLRGYARVDFRVDSQGRPWILEVNANPCLSADAGFIAALEEAGLDQREAVARILGLALRAKGGSRAPCAAE